MGPCELVSSRMKHKTLYPSQRRGQEVIYWGGGTKGETGSMETNFAQF